MPQYSKCCTYGVSFSDSPIWICPLSPQKLARTRGGVSITEPVKEGSTVAISAEGDPQYHFYKVIGKQNTSELITDDYGTEFPQTLISYKAILSQRKFYRHDLQSWQENVCSGCPVDMLHIWNIKWMEQRKAEQRGPKLLKLTTEQQEESLGTSWATCKWKYLGMWYNLCVRLSWNIECNIYFHFLKLYLYFLKSSTTCMCILCTWAGR